MSLKIIPKEQNIKSWRENLQPHLHYPFRFVSLETLQLMAQLFTPGAQFPSRKHLYAARNQLHRTTGYKLVVQNCNKEQVIFVCNQANALPPKLKCPVKVRANCGKHTSVWTISPHAKFDHLCNVEDHPLPTKSTKAIAEHLSSRIQHELHSLPTAPGLITSFKTDEGTHPSLKTVYVQGYTIGERFCFWN